MEPIPQTDTINTDSEDGSPQELQQANHEPKLNKAIQQQLIKLLQAVPAQRMNRNIRKIFIDFLYQNLNCQPIDMEDYLDDIYHLTNFLDTVQLNPQDWHRKEE